MAGLELLSDQGYRLDGRRPGELRRVRARMGVFGQADGSAYLEQGNTRTLAVVYGPHEVRTSQNTQGSVPALNPLTTKPHILDSEPVRDPLTSLWLPSASPG